VLRRLLRSHLRPYRRVLVLIAVLQAVQAAAALLVPRLNATLINDGVLPGDTGFILRIGAFMLVASLVQGAFAAAAVYHGARVAMGFGRDARANLFHRVTAFSAREVGSFGAPSLITRITNDVQQVQILVVMTATMAIGAPITIAVGIAMALQQDLGLSVILAVAIPAAAVVLGVIVARLVPAFQLMQERIDQVNRVLREQITGIRIVRAFTREPDETARFERANAEVTEVALRAGRLMASMFPIVNLLINGSSVAVIWIGADRVASGAINVGALVAYLSYLVQILWSVVMATFVLSMVPRASVSATRIQEVLDTDPSVEPPTDPVTALEERGRLELRDVGFHYPGAEHPVLSGVGFTVRAGSTTAIVGSTGAGKTTLVNLVPRLVDATEGTVLVGGVDVRRLDPTVLTDAIGLVPQKAFLFAGTVASNLRYGRPDATDDEMWEALAVAQAEDFVRRMPGGLEARIEQGGTNVSGGQRQRLSIARALVRRADLYVFDDSFSALDVATDARLRTALRPWAAGAAVVIVAQRISTVADADQIVVLDDGRVVGLGTHDELLTSCPTYLEIVESQLGEGQAA
jgi:ATP-binding cassette, subfamily B, multidrug efflux pump